FLLLVTQRPDKVDPMVLSERENIAIMKLSSEAVVKEVCKLMDLPGLAEEELSGCTQLQTGRGLFFGPWIGSPTRFFSAARRTVEGGRNLRSEYWASPS